MSAGGKEWRRGQCEDDEGVGVTKRKVVTLR